LCIGTILLIYTVAFGNPLRPDSETHRNANSTKTAIALTAQGLLGPFPTSTAFTSTPSPTPGFTPTGATSTPLVVTILPSQTPTRTRQPVPTATNSPLSP
ncbi:MAG: hypothetical protein WCC12_12395, partial [Anaerolineales bacterium]